MAEAFTVHCKYCNNVIVDSQQLIGFDKGTQQAFFKSLHSSKFFTKNRESTNDPSQQYIYCNGCRNRIGKTYIHHNDREYCLPMTSITFVTSSSPTISEPVEDTDFRLLETQSAVLSIRDQMTELRRDVDEFKQETRTQLRKYEASLDEIRTVLLHHKNILEDLMRQKK